MSRDNPSLIDWEPFEAEIKARYLDQNQTLEATLKYMKETHGLRSTYVLQNLGGP